MRTVYNDGGLSESNIKDSACCIVKSIAIAFNIPFTKAHEICKEAGRKINRGFHMEPILPHLAKRGFKFKRYRLGRKGMTIRKFIEKNPIGLFICIRRGHAFALIHGDVNDTIQNSERHIIQKAWEVQR
jgi:hypothetical protein